MYIKKSMNEENKLEVSTLINENNIKENKKEVWESCCIRTNPHAIAYIGQIVVSVIILAFSFIMLIKSNGSCEQSSPYIGLISFLMGKILSGVVGSG